MVFILSNYPNLVFVKLLKNIIPEKKLIIFRSKKPDYFLSNLCRSFDLSARIGSINLIIIVNVKPETEA